MRPKIKSFHSPEIAPIELDKWEPEDPEDFWILVQLEIGLNGDEKADLYDVSVVTPKALQKHKSNGSIIIFDRNLIVVTKFDWTEIFAHLSDVIKKCASGISNDQPSNSDVDRQIEFQHRLQRYFGWEYEDHP